MQILKCKKTTFTILLLLAQNIMSMSANSHRAHIPVEEIVKARERLQGISFHTPLTYVNSLSEIYECNVFFKREDLQVVRSYKIRGAYNKLSQANKQELEKGVIAASAGNHAQGVAFSCQKLKIKCKIYMPVTTPKQKINKVKTFGKQWVEVILEGNNFDQSLGAALEAQQKSGALFAHAFNDVSTMAGQGTVALEIVEDTELPIDYVFAGIGGGGFIAGLSSYFREVSPDTKIIGVEPLGAASMFKSMQQGKVSTFENMDPFVDGCAVGTPGHLTYPIVRDNVDDIVVIPEGKTCTTILQVYNDEGIVVEPAGALTMSALDFYKEEIKGKTIVVIISGGNNDVARFEEINRRSQEYEAKYPTWKDKLEKSMISLKFPNGKKVDDVEAAIPEKSL